MDSTSNYAESPRQRELPGVSAVASGDNQKLPVSDPSKSKESNIKGLAMTRKGAYAAVSYMACAGSFLFLFICPCLYSISFFPFCIIRSCTTFLQNSFLVSPFLLFDSVFSYALLGW